MSQSSKPTPSVNPNLPATSQDKPPRRHIAYKWIALSNTTLGVLMASINGNIILISLPAIFRGMGVDPLSPSGANYMLWMLMGFTVVTATLLVTLGRLSDIFGRVRLYNLGFAIFTVASILCYFTPASGGTGLTIMIIFRLLQGVGSGFLFANSMAIITDAFKAHERGGAMGLNQISSVGGTLLGLILGGVLSAINWRLVFLVSVPIGVFGTVWAYLKLKEQSKPDKSQKIDWAGNATFAVGLTLVLIAMTTGIQPYGDSKMGWGNPFVIGGLILGVVCLVAFVFIELHVKSPMFHLQLFKIRAFAMGNISLFLSSIARGGLQFILVIWLQGIWLPLHGYSYDSTPLWSGIYMLPMMGGFFIMGPLCGRLSDRFGARWFATGGMAISVVGFLALNFLPADFHSSVFFIILAVLGIGMGMFAAPNTSAIMNAVPPSQRGASSGMRSTFQNTGTALSMTLYFTILILGLAQHLPSVLNAALLNAGVPTATAAQVSEMPPTSALFAAFLGFNPMEKLVPPEVMAALPQATQQTLVSNTFFPEAVSPAVMSSLHIAFWVSAGLSLVAAVISWFRGGKYVYEETMTD
ncbi:MAG: MFS transporter [Propionibacteriaceae bacterium]|jgi:EmrB/QacA subfamily drug resistance transporter|nr:MFS transporter [Propionibacteriaceae bacterium]